MTGVPIKFENDDIRGYQRWNYKWWYALAEFVDNSTHNYYQFRDKIDDQLNHDGERFHVRITNDSSGDQDVISIYDNALGMGLKELEDAFDFGRRKVNPGRSAFGLGMKTAAIWMGDMFRIETSQLGSDKKYTLTFDVQKVAMERLRELDIVEEVAAPSEHYTKITVWNLKKRLRGRTVGKVKDYLASIYRIDIRGGDLDLYYNGSKLEWLLYDDSHIMKAKDGALYKENVDFTTSLGNRITGWFGIFAAGKGGRTKAGFTTIQNQRVVQGYPSAWRPESVFGAAEAGTLVQQRLFGEFNFIGFDISQTKDEILFSSEDEYDEIEDHLKQVTFEYKQIAAARRGGGGGGGAEAGPSQAAVEDALDEIGKELESDLSKGLMVLDPVVPSEVLRRQDEEMVSREVENNAPDRTYQIGDTTVKMYFASVSSREPYYVNESPNSETLIVIVNQSHPHWRMLGNAEVQSYLRHCVLDGVAEHRVMRLRNVQSVDERTVKEEKDKLLRLRFEILED